MPLWIRQRSAAVEQDEVRRLRLEKENVLANQRQRLKRLRENEDLSLQSAKRIRLLVAPHEAPPPVPLESDYLMEDYESDDESSSAAVSRAIAELLSREEALKRLEDEPDLEGEQREKERSLPTRKIFFCSRTHSQLSQFVSEVRHSGWSDSIKLLVLASRKNLCINPDVVKLSNQTLIADKCLDLIGNVKDSTKSKCQFYYTPRLESMSDHILYQPRDIEDLTSLGQFLHACPYYGTRHALHTAELVLLPYQMLLHQQTRESLGIELEGNIVIIDEAHNLIEAINAIHSVELTAHKLAMVRRESH